jgi:hypothetical protein
MQSTARRSAFAGWDEAAGDPALAKPGRAERMRPLNLAWPRRRAKPHKAGEEFAPGNI